MVQFDIVKNRKKRNDVEFLINLQSESVSLLDTRIVAPLRRADNFEDKMISNVHFSLTVNGESYIAFISELAAVPTNILGECVGNAENCRTEIISAIDLLFTGF